MRHLMALVWALCAAGAPAVLAADLFVAANSAGTVNRVTPTGVMTEFFSMIPESPLNLAFDAQRNLYVSEGANLGFIRKYSTSGSFLGFFGPANLPAPTGLAFDASGNLYVACNNDGTVRKISPSGANLGVFVGGLVEPDGIAFDAAGNLYVVESGLGVDSLRRYPAGGGASQVIASNLNDPRGIALDAAGNVYVASLGSNHIRRFSPDGADLGVFANVAGPCGLAFDADGRLYVAQNLEHAVRRFSATGTNLGVFASAPGFGPYGLAFGPLANVPEPGAAVAVAAGWLILGGSRRHCTASGQRPTGG